ncbi:MAG: ABC transporter ATP-binding protein/permease [Burkholderiales bacterium]|nr:ABC transporter ATP-binding protein/permease [Burkholderiales bacterium]
MNDRKLLLGEGGFLARVWRLLVPYWKGDERVRAWLLLVGTVAAALGVVYTEVLVNQWSRPFFNAVEQKSVGDFERLLVHFGVLAALMTVAAMYKVYLQQMLEMRWRVWLTHAYVSDWLADKVYYHLELEARGTDNPDQRMQEDLKFFTGVTLDLALGLLASFVSLVSFVVILWRLSGTLVLELPGAAVGIPGYMVWAALGYAIAGSVLSHFIGRPLIALNFQKQRLEADFRFALVRLRENAEGAALYGGEAREKAGLFARFEDIRRNWWRLMRYTRRLTAFRTGYNQLAVVFPFLVAAPRYFAGETDFGTLMQTAAAFAAVQVALSWFVTNYQGIAEWKASADRLLTFHDALVATAAERRRETGIGVLADGGGAYAAEALELVLPNGRPIVAGAAFTIRPGDQVLVTGPSGSGKSTLFRALAGIWPFGRGRVRVPAGARVMFLPQKPYVPTGSLREVVAYPSPPDAFGAAEIARVLAAVRLDALVPRLDETANWAMQLSGGEQQKLALARALLHRPDWLFLDEATSALDEETERAFYGLLAAELPGTTVVSIAHRAGLDAFHGRHFRFEPTEGPTRVVGG